VVTGASSGIGLATARAFARRGDNVVLVARGIDRLAEAAAQCAALGGRALALPGDVTDAQRMRAVADQTVTTFGGLDVWVNNAGTSLWGPFEEIPIDTHRRLVEINLLGALNGVHAALPHLVRAERGVIINVVSIAGRLAMPWTATYTATKFGLAGLTDALRVELRNHSGVEVCGVYPAFVDTPTPVNSANYTGRSLRPVPPVVPPERVAGAIVKLSLRPRRARRVGALHALSGPYALAPATTGRIAAGLGRRFLFSAGSPAPATDGALFTAVPAPALTRSGWGEPQRRRARLAVGAATALAATGLALSVLRRRR
jgi:NAD(P)-dependent dehydrogenase (short-subunit alcohol dehydrogenase family)